MLIETQTRPCIHTFPYTHGHVQAYTCYPHTQLNIDLFDIYQLRQFNFSRETLYGLTCARAKKTNISKSFILCIWKMTYFFSIHTHTHIWMHTYIQVHTHTHTDTHTHADIQIFIYTFRTELKLNIILEQTLKRNGSTVYKRVTKKIAKMR